MEANGQLHALDALPPEKEPLVPIGWEAGWTPKTVWTRWRRDKIPANARNRTTVAQSVAQSLYWVIPAQQRAVVKKIHAWNFTWIRTKQTLSCWPLSIQPPIQWVQGPLNPVVKRPGREANHSPPSMPRSKNAWSCTSTPQYVFMPWYLVKHRGTSRARSNTNRVTHVRNGTSLRNWGNCRRNFILYWKERDSKKILIFFTVTKELEHNFTPYQMDDNQ
jgi:hypothetical protein